VAGGLTFLNTVLINFDRSPGCLPTKLSLHEGILGYCYGR
jgi:hypothetical protein